MLSLGQAHIRPMVSPCSQQIGHSFSSHFTDQTYLEKTTIIIDSERKVQPGANWLNRASLYGLMQAQRTSASLNK